MINYDKIIMKKKHYFEISYTYPTLSRAIFSFLNEHYISSLSQLI